jgi:hypothetical protein
MFTILLGLKIKFGSDGVGNRFFIVSILSSAMALLVHSYTVHKAAVLFFLSCDMLVEPVAQKS